jgi:hypothetical protein
VAVAIGALTARLLPHGIIEVRVAPELCRETGMPMKKYELEQIVTLLRQIEIEIADGKNMPNAC